MLNSLTRTVEPFRPVNGTWHQWPCCDVMGVCVCVCVCAAFRISSAGTLSIAVLGSGLATSQSLSPPLVDGGPTTNRQSGQVVFVRSNRVRPRPHRPRPQLCHL